MWLLQHVRGILFNECWIKFKNINDADNDKITNNMWTNVKLFIILDEIESMITELIRKKLPWKCLRIELIKAMLAMIIASILDVFLFSRYENFNQNHKLCTK